MVKDLEKTKKKMKPVKMEGFNEGDDEDAAENDDGDDGGGNVQMMYNPVKPRGSVSRRVSI